MSSGRPNALAGVAFLVGAALLLTATAEPTWAQSAEVDRPAVESDLERMIDSLAPLVAGAAIEAEAARKARMAEARRRAATRRSLDTLQVADMTIVAPLEDSEVARELFTEVWSESFRGYESRSLEERTFTYQGALYDVEEILVDGTRQQVVIAAWHSRDQARARVRSSIGRAIAADLQGTRMGLWATGNPFALRDPARLYRQLVVARSAAARRCMDGSVDSCAATLGLGVGDDVLDVWYTPEERRERVMAWAGLDPTRRNDDLPARWTNLYGTVLGDCVRLSTPDACDAFMEPALDMWTPVPSYMRETLVALALRRGGPEAWARLVADPEMEPEEALSLAAGVPLNELVAEWRQWIVGSRPEAYAGLGRSSLLTLAWIVFFAAVATRSKRWRFA